MALAQNPSANVDLFDAYFRRADLDGDGRISGAEAVAFFQGSGLPKQVLAQIWAHADSRQAGFLSRPEFYNALKLVTVAQKRELTPELVKAALYGPAAAKIPAPQINLMATPSPQPNSAAAAPATPSSAAASPLNQNVGFSGPQVNASTNQLMRPPLPTSISVSQPAQGIATQGFSGTSSITVHRPGSAPVGTTSQVPNKGFPPLAQDGFGLVTSGSTAFLPPTSQPASGIKPLESVTKDSKEMGISGNGFTPGSFFGGDVFSATPSQTKQDTSARSLPVSSALAPNVFGSQPSVRPAAIDNARSLPVTQVTGGQFQLGQSVAPNKVSSQSASPAAVPGVSLRVENTTSNQSQMPWPKMTQADVQKYTKVFLEVDKDRDGKITGEQARNLFLSWRLPREVLKQVWDLSDQDNDSMLSLREFCIAVYLMERYREGRPLPPALPSNVIFDTSSIVQPTTNFSNTGSAAWRPTGFQQPVMPGPGARHMTPAVGGRPPLPPSIPKSEEEPQADRPKSRVPELEKHLIDQLSTEEQNSLNSKFKEATEADKKVEELEKEIMESREKIEFYRVKMQELILYKSRCDNRLNEIMERTIADKREAESLAKKYEEKYKQTGDVASKLTIEEATFRDIQEKKMELYQAIVKMEKDGSADGVLQERAERIQSELDELVKALNERCKKYGLRAKPRTLTELPFGWQAGIQEGAADWDEDWDKFEDEGFSFVKELTLDVQNVVAPPKQKSTLTQYTESYTAESPTAVSSPKVDTKPDTPRSVDERIVENGSAHEKSEDFTKSDPNSPIASSAIGSPSGLFTDSLFGKPTSGFDASPRDNHSDHGGAGSVFSGDKSFDDPAWGTFDNNDDLDSVWGFNSISTTKDMEHERNNDNYFFGAGDFGLNPIRTGSQNAGSPSQNNRSFAFDDSVPSTPLYNLSTFSPKYNKDGSEPSFDSFSRFDSFNSTHDSGFFPSKDTFSRFDSVRGSRDFDQSQGFPSFDDSDPFGSSGPFRTSLDSQTPKKGTDSWSAF
ncbi:hypothetical protein UlMin_032077 [Ulmus minor]